MGSKQLRLSKTLALPLEAATQTFGVLGKRGSGKTYAAAVLSEELLDVGLPLIVLDPLSVWWGLRSSASGKGPGFPILVLGGEHGDLPLDAGAGKLVADFVVAKRASAVLDMGEMSKTDQRRFVAEFLEQLYRKNREALHVVLDEADAFAPQRLYKGSERCFGAVDQVVRRGRARGLGVTLVTQRSAAINKDVLSQVEVLVCFRTLSPQDRKAIDAWIEFHADQEQREQVLHELATLPVGTAFVWAPGWLGLLEKTRFRERRTFDSSATPEVGARAEAPKSVAPVDVEAFRGELEQLVQKAEDEDPRRLQRRVRELEAQLAKLPAAAPKVKEVKVAGAGLVRSIDRVLRETREGLERAPSIAEAAQKAALQEFRDVVNSAVRRLEPLLQDLVAAVGKAQRVEGSTVQVPRKGPDRDQQGPRRRAPAAAAPDGVSLRAGERRMLQVLAQRHPLELTVAQLGTLSRFKPSGGTFRTYIGTLSRHGLVDRNGRIVKATEAGLAYLGDDVPAAPATTEELQAMWREKLRAGEARMLDELIAAYPGAITPEELGARTGFEASGGTFRTYVGTLTRNGLASRDGATIRASEALFPSWD